MPRVKPGTPRKTKHTSFACTEEEFDLIHLTAASLRMTPSALVRTLILKKYNSLVESKWFESLELRGDDNDNSQNP